MEGAFHAVACFAIAAYHPPSASWAAAVTRLASGVGVDDGRVPGREAVVPGVGGVSTPTPLQPVSPMSAPPMSARLVRPSDCMIPRLPGRGYAGPQRGHPVGRPPQLHLTIEGIAVKDSSLRALLEPLLAERALELDTLEVIPAGRRRLVRITVDGDGPAGRGPLLDDIASATRAISDALDASPVMGDNPYTLEVSSRGVTRPLTEVRHYRRNLRRLVLLTRTEAAPVTGRIVAVTDDVLTLDVDGAHVEQPLSGIRKAVVQVELNRPPEPGETDLDEVDDEEFDDDEIDDDEFDDDDASDVDDEEK